MKFHSATIFLTVCLGLSLEQQQQNDVRGVFVAASQAADLNVPADNYESRQASPNSFYPSFSNFQAPPLGHSRPVYYSTNQEGAYSQRSQPFEQLFDVPEKFTGFAKEDYVPVPEKPKSNNILGSGNFGVIRGGTFYNDNDERASNNYGDFNAFYQNGHGRPSYYGKPSNTKPVYQQQFANFKDFADINSPSVRQYSQYVVVYANRNNTETAQPSAIKSKPKNIIESLALLDLETTTSTEKAPTKKLSRSKVKLAMLLPEKKHEAKLLKKATVTKETKEMNEPLLALS